MIEEIKHLRLDIDETAKMVKSISGGGIPNSEELAISERSLYLAKAWLGKVLGSLGNDSPYPNDGERNSIKDIEPTAEQFKDIIEVDRTLNTIQKVDRCRQKIESLVETLIDKSFDNELSKYAFKNDDKQMSIAKTNAYNYLCEARFWLGFELQRIREDEQ